VEVSQDMRQDMGQNLLLQLLENENSTMTFGVMDLWHELFSSQKSHSRRFKQLLEKFSSRSKIMPFNFSLN
jgi:hypothetical protein